MNNAYGQHAFKTELYGKVVGMGSGQGYKASIDRECDSTEASSALGQSQRSHDVWP